MRTYFEDPEGNNQVCIDQPMFLNIGEEVRLNVSNKDPKKWNVSEMAGTFRIIGKEVIIEKNYAESVHEHLSIFYTVVPVK